MATKWTAEQQNAIDARRGTVLVSAAAGSGKTAVLVERVIQRLCDPDSPTDADRLLIVTFTKAAAAEMKERISARLSAMLEASPGDSNLKRQQMLLRRANISTIHGFCARVVKENFYKLGISPSFYIADEGELALFREQAISAVLAEAYETGGEPFRQLVEAFSGDRDDKKLVATILRVYDFTRSHAFPELWMRETAALYNGETPIAKTPWGKVMLRYIGDTVRHCIALTETALRCLEEDETLQKAYGPSLDADRDMLRSIAAVCEKEDWNAVITALQNREFVKFGSARGYKDDPLALQVKKLRQNVKDAIGDKLLSKLPSAEDCREDILRQRVLIDELFRLTKNFSSRLSEIKAQKRAADFNDLERWTLDLLYEERDGQYILTAEAEQIAQQFDEIIVDEYQDTNQAQDRIFRAISKDEGNLFLVGDVKQSIYGFRQAMPQIFIDRRSAYPVYDREQDNYPACIVLDRNFRSRKTVTDTVNYLFRQLMSADSGDVDYDDREALVAGAQYDPQDGTETSLDIIEADAVQDETLDEDMAVLEARRIGERIAAMVGEGFQVTDHGVKRPATYSDFAILLRSANNHMAKYVKELQQNGIPAKSGKNPGFFETAEIAVILSLLRVINNPMQDIPLASVLMSPLYGFTPDDLADIRVADRKASLYLALQQAAENGMEQAAAFLQDLDEYRTFAATQTADRMLNHIYAKSGYPSLVQAMSNGERRLANLQLLLEYAAKFESAGYNGVGGFVRFVDKLQRQNGDLIAAETAQGADNAVQIMSIHNSKGLEFPVCFVAGCNRKFNRAREDVVLHPELGLGVMLRDENTPSKYTTLMREAIFIAQDRESMAEELRVLYVALTRAREKLILVTTEKSLAARLAALSAGITKEQRLEPYGVSSARSVSDWLLTCALRHPDGYKLRQLAGVPVETWQDDETPALEVQCLLPQPAWEPETAADTEKAQPDSELLAELRSRIHYQYTYSSLLDLPAKVTASALAEEEADRQAPLEAKNLSRPSFLYSKGLTPAERGTATHVFLQFCDFDAARQNPQAELERLLQMGFLTPEQGEAVDFGKVSRFFESSLAKRMLRSTNLQREYRFTADIPASMVKDGLARDLADQPVVLQGAVDCVFEEDGQLVIVDYKTDFVKDQSVLWERYRKQLSLYAMAMEQCIGLPVKETLLYSFYLDAAISG